MEQADAEQLPGPALLYVHSEEHLDGTRQITRADMSVPLEGGLLSEGQARRERGVLRALLVHALWLLDQEDR